MRKSVLKTVAAGLCSLSVAGSEEPEIFIENARDAILALGRIDRTPAVFDAPGIEIGSGSSKSSFQGDPGQYRIRPLFYEGLPWKGKPTRVFAWYGVPENMDGKVPAMVLVHGGGGTAFPEWVRQWNDRGFAALAIAHEGQIDVKDGRASKEWKRHEWAGPGRNGCYEDSNAPIEEQWMYHAVADAVLARLLLASMPEVDSARIGIAGISWGGVITSTVIGIDRRFLFAISSYGCGLLADSENSWGRNLGSNQLYRQVWDPFLRLPQVILPVLWHSWPEDNHFDIRALTACSRALSGPGVISLRPEMGHSHPGSWSTPDAYEFARSIIKSGEPWARQISIETGSPATLVFKCSRPVDQAVLVSTTDRGFTGSRNWTTAPVYFRTEGDLVTVAVDVPPETTGWFVNLHCGELIVSSDVEGDTMPRL
jgi:dienelactone hydrolase